MTPAERGFCYLFAACLATGVAVYNMARIGMVEVDGLDGRMERCILRLEEQDEETDGGFQNGSRLAEYVRGLLQANSEGAHMLRGQGDCVQGEALEAVED
jgi:hypothetical protein